MCLCFVCAKEVINEMKNKNNWKLSAATTKIDPVFKKATNDQANFSSSTTPLAPKLPIMLSYHVIPTHMRAYIHSYILTNNKNHRQPAAHRPPGNRRRQPVALLLESINYEFYKILLQPRRGGKSVRYIHIHTYLVSIYFMYEYSST